MATGLPVELVDETALALTSMLRLTLPPERWDAVGEAVLRMDDAVALSDAAEVRIQLSKLRSAVIGTAPRPRPGDGVAPAVNPLSYRTTDYETRTSVRSIALILGSAGAVLAVLIVGVLVLLSVGGNDRVPLEPPEPPPTSQLPAPEPAEPARESGAGIYLTTLGVLAVAGVAGFVFVIWRRRAAAPVVSATTAPSALRNTTRESPPPDLVRATERLVRVLAGR